MNETKKKKRTFFARMIANCAVLQPRSAKPRHSDLSQQVTLKISIFPFFLPFVPFSPLRRIHPPGIKVSEGYSLLSIIGNGFLSKIFVV
jgi:hypothetical protein